MNSAIILILVLTVGILYFRFKKAEDKALELDLRQQNEKAHSEREAAREKVNKAEQTAKEKVLNYEEKRNKYLASIQRDDGSGSEPK